jgi:hypothetical protein
LTVEEEWRAIPGYEDHYAVSSLGRVKRVAKYRVEPGVLKQAVTRFGYAYVTLCVNNHRKKHHVHRLVLAAFLGSQPRKIDGCHSDGNRLNNNLENLRWDSRIGNMADAKRQGRTLAGTRNPLAKLTPDQVVRIRADQRSQSAIAVEYGIHQSTVSDIKKGRRWGHLQSH